MDLLTPREAAERLGMSERRVQQLIRAGALTATRKIGNTQMLSGDDVAKLAEQPAPSQGWERGRPRTPQPAE